MRWSKEQLEEKKELVIHYKKWGRRYDSWKRWQQNLSPEKKEKLRLYKKEWRRLQRLRFKAKGLTSQGKVFGPPKGALEAEIDSWYEKKVNV